MGALRRPEPLRCSSNLWIDLPDRRAAEQREGAHRVHSLTGRQHLQRIDLQLRQMSLGNRAPLTSAITEFVLTYDVRPSYTVSIMEFQDGMVARETQYFADPFEPGPSRARWVEPMR